MHEFFHVIPLAFQPKLAHSLKRFIASAPFRLDMKFHCLFRETSAPAQLGTIWFIRFKNSPHGMDDHKPYAVS